MVHELYLNKAIKRKRGRDELHLTQRKYFERQEQSVWIFSVPENTKGKSNLVCTNKGKNIY